MLPFQVAVEAAVSPCRGMARVAAKRTAGVTATAAAASMRTVGNSAAGGVDGGSSFAVAINGQSNNNHRIARPIIRVEAMHNAGVACFMTKAID